MPFHKVLDITVALLVEVYRDLGLKFDDVMRELSERLEERTEQTKSRAPDPAEEAASLAMLTSMVSQSTFKGARG